MFVRGSVTAIVFSFRLLSLFSIICDYTMGALKNPMVDTRVRAKYIGTCTCLYLGTFFRVLACTLYLSFKNLLVRVPKYITKYLVIEDKYIASTSRFFQKNIYYNLLFQLFSAIFLRI